MTRETFEEGKRRLKVDVLTMGAQVREAIERAMTALVRRDEELAARLVAGDAEFDQRELQLEHACLTLLALRQPLARDLRLIGGTLKMLTDLERMADHAADIAKITLRLAGKPFVKPLVDIPQMAAIVQSMTADALDAYALEDSAKALAMIARDDEVDHLFSTIFKDLLQLMAENPAAIEGGSELLMVANHLERIGDHATNLGEWVVYMVTGDRVSLND